MAYVNRLVNPTPYKVEIPYDRGTFINIPPDGEFEFPNADVQRDFEPGQAGSEEVRNLLEATGTFLLNPDLSYDLQALRALQSCVKVKKSFRDEFIQRLRDGRIATGRSIDDGTLQEAIESAGYGTKSMSRTGIPGLQGQIDALEQRIVFLKKAVESDPVKGYVKDKLDPEKTCFVTNPPRQFPSKTALTMFLSENADIAELHNKWLKAQNG